MARGIPETIQRWHVIALERRADDLAGILAEDCFASCGDGEAPRRGDPEGVHRLTDEDLAEHRPERRPAVSTA